MNWRLVGRYSIALGAVLLVLSSITWGADKASANNADSDVVKRIQKSADVLNEIMGTPDKAIPNEILEDAKCIAVIPSMVKYGPMNI